DRVAEVNQWRQKDCNRQFYEISCKSRRKILLECHFSCQIKCNPQNNERIEELRDHCRSGAAQPNHFVARTFLEKLEQRRVDKLRYQKRRDASHNNPHTLPENSGELLVTNRFHNP